MFIKITLNCIINVLILLIKHFMEKSNNSIFSRKPPSVEQSFMYPNQHINSREETRISNSTKDQFPDFCNIPKVINEFSSFSEKVKKMTHKISMVFDFIILGKQKDLINIVIKTARTFNKSNPMPKTPAEQEEIPPFTHKVSSQLENSSTLRIEHITQRIKTKRKIKDHINTTLATDVKALNESLTKSSDVLRELAEQPAAQGESIKCKEALQHLAKVNHELRNMKSSTKKVHDDFDSLKELMKGKKRLKYQSLSSRQQKVFTEARVYCQDLGSEIGPIKDAFSSGVYSNFGRNFETAHKLSSSPVTFKKGMTIKMNSPLLNCTITFHSQRELDRFQKRCFQTEKLLSSFREDIPYITRFAAEDSFTKVLKEVKYR